MSVFSEMTVYTTGISTASLMAWMVSTPILLLHTTP